MGLSDSLANITLRISEADKIDVEFAAAITYARKVSSALVGPLRTRCRALIFIESRIPFTQFGTPQDT